MTVGKSQGTDSAPRLHVLAQQSSDIEVASALQQHRQFKGSWIQGRGSKSSSVIAVFWTFGNVGRPVTVHLELLPELGLLGREVAVAVASLGILTEDTASFPPGQRMLRRASTASITTTRNIPCIRCSSRDQSRQHIYLRSLCKSLRFRTAMSNVY